MVVGVVEPTVTTGGVTAGIKKWYIMANRCRFCISDMQVIRTKLYNWIFGGG